MSVVMEGSVPTNDDNLSSIIADLVQLAHTLNNLKSHELAGQVQDAVQRIAEIKRTMRAVGLLEKEWKE